MGRIRAASGCRPPERRPVCDRWDDNPEFPSGLGGHKPNRNWNVDSSAVESTWETRDLPVLEAAIKHAEEHGAIPGAYGSTLIESTNLSAEEVERALVALDGEYIEVQKSLGGGPTRWRVSRIYPGARRAVGQWPSADIWADRLISALREAADNEPDPGKRSKLAQAADALGSLGGQVVGGVITAYVTHVSGLG
jgi:hypothetical protein